MSAQDPAQHGSCPCKGCRERHEACHDRCPAYQRFREEVARIREAERQAHEEDRLGRRIFTGRPRRWKQ